MRPKIPLPRAWNRRAKSAILYRLALSHYAFTTMLPRAANERSRRTRLRAEMDRLNHTIAGGMRVVILPFHYRTRGPAAMVP